MLGIARGEDGESNGVNYGKCGFITWPRPPLSSGVMPEPWTVERIEAAAPDSSSATAGRKLAKPGPWSDIGFQGNLLWGACQGSGKTPYRVSIDTASPAYKCSCPSRKFPCKHALALLFLWAQGQVSESGEIAGFASQWAGAREARAGRKKTEARERTEEQKAAATKRAAQREERVANGLTELDRFLADQLRQGLATHVGDRSRRLEHMAARMVDAQAPGIASRLRELATVPSSGDWPTQVVDGYGSLHLLAVAWAGRDKLPSGLAETVRSHIGFTTRVEDVLMTPGVRDRWVVLGMHDADEEQVSVRRVWLWGRETGRRALVLFFARGGDGFDTSLYPGTEIDADLHFYPGRPPLRAAVGSTYAELPRVSGWELAGDDVATAISQLRDAVAADPWCEAWPVAIQGSLTWESGGCWLVSERAVALTGTHTDHWRMLAEIGTTPVTVFGELSADGLRPIAYLREATVCPL